MCGRFGLSHKRNEIVEYFNVSIEEIFEPRYNIAPTQPVLIVRENVHHPDGLEAAHVVWGLIPPWADDIKIGQKMFNARSETAAEKPSFRHALRRRRCLIPASGFYEWETVAGRKQPWFIYPADEKPMGLAGLWEIWNGPNGEQIESCTILTRPAAGLMTRLHERMPVIIQPELFPVWLDTSNDDPRTLTRFFEHDPTESLTMKQSSPLVNNARNEGPDLLQNDLF